VASPTEADVTRRSEGSSPCLRNRLAFFGIIRREPALLWVQATSDRKKATRHEQRDLQLAAASAGGADASGARPRPRSQQQPGDAGRAAHDGQRRRVLPPLKAGLAVLCPGGQRGRDGATPASLAETGVARCPGWGGGPPAGSRREPRSAPLQGPAASLRVVGGRGVLRGGQGGLRQCRPWTTAWPRPRPITQRLTGRVTTKATARAPARASRNSALLMPASHRAGHRQHDRVVDDLHRRDGERVGVRCVVVRARRHGSRLPGSVAGNRVSRRPGTRPSWVVGSPVCRTRAVPILCGPSFGVDPFNTGPPPADGTGVSRTGGPR
jgi:hypothetical protein